MRMRGPNNRQFKIRRLRTTNYGWTSVKSFVRSTGLSRAKIER